MNTNESAFPFVETTREGESVSTGLTKRELIAAMALQGLLAGRFASEERLDCSPETLATLAVNHADQLLAELSNS